jgi:hypothetical protein
MLPRLRVNLRVWACHLLRCAEVNQRRVALSGLRDGSCWLWRSCFASIAGALAERYNAQSQKEHPGF